MTYFKPCHPKYTRVDDLLNTEKPSLSMANLNLRTTRNRNVKKVSASNKYHQTYLLEVLTLYTTANPSFNKEHYLHQIYFELCKPENFFSSHQPFQKFHYFQVQQQYEKAKLL